MCPVGSSPDFAGNFLHECDLGPLLFLGEFVADFAGSESTLGTEAEAFERNVLRRLVYAPNHGGFVLQLRSFGGDESEHHVLAFGHVGQRCEAARAFVVEFEVEGVDSSAKSVFDTAS